MPYFLWKDGDTPIEFLTVTKDVVEVDFLSNSFNIVLNNRHGDLLTLVPQITIDTLLLMISSSNLLIII